MLAHVRVLTPMLGALAGLAALAAAPTAAQAGEKPTGGCCKPKPPSCCAPKDHTVKVPGVKIYPPSVVVVPPSVVVTGKAVAVANASASASASAFGNSTVIIGGGGGGFFAGPGSASAIGTLNVEGIASAVQRVPYQAQRTQVKTVVIRAVCLDDRLVPHPASQVFPGQDVAETYEGELYRCIAGSRLQITIADWMGKIAFDGGSNLECAKGEALWYGRGGGVTCRPAKPARDCNERSLLRRYGVGVKVLKMVRVETYTAWREEVIQSAVTTSGGIVLDGGVGGVVF